MAKKGSVAPKERINIVYKSKVDGQEEVELPFKMLVMQDLTGQPKEEDVEDREPVKIDRETFNEVMESYDLNMDISVRDRLSNDEDEEGLLPMHLKFKNLRDFTPDGIATQVPELQKLLELRDALSALKSPLGNKGNFRKKIQSMLADENTRKQMLEELGLDDNASKGEATPTKEDN